MDWLTVESVKEEEKRQPLCFLTAAPGRLKSRRNPLYLESVTFTRSSECCGTYKSSSTRAKLFALKTALEELVSIEGYDTLQPVVVCTDSMAQLALPQSGPAAQSALC